jgi:hypothetical protein
MNTPMLTTHQKALALNLDAKTYGSIAEIGGGQEVARWFFRVGGAAGTVAKTISAYDMAISDRIYGAAKPYVSRKRLDSMLDSEFAMVSDQLKDKAGESRRFFAFADTVATRRFHSSDHGHGWIGIRFQAQPRQEPSQITLHVHLLDAAPEREQDALGILGVNLIYGACLRHDSPPDLIASLMDELTRERIEIDMIKFAGPAFPGVDNRLMSLQLVEKGFTDAAMFTADGEVVQPSEVLYKKPILIERARFRPVTKLTVDLLERARDAFVKQPDVAGQQPVVLAEMSLRNFVQSSDMGHADFLARAETLGALGFDVLISNFELNYEVADYLAAYTDKPIGVAVGLRIVKKFVEEQFYTGLAGGVLEGAGRLFKRSVKIYVYPARDPKSGKIETIDDVVVPSPWQHLFQLLRELGRLQALRPSDEGLLSIDPQDVSRRIIEGDASWETMVPQKAAEIIKSKHLFFEKADPPPQAATAVQPS